MAWYEAAVWGIVGASTLQIISIAAEFIFYKRRLSEPPEWRLFIIISSIEIVIGAITCILVDQASPSLSVPAALLVGAAGPLLLGFIVSVFITLPRAKRYAMYKEHRRQVDHQIADEAERLAAARGSQQATPHGVSPDVAGILAARQEALTGHLPIVHPDEGSN